MGGEAERRLCEGEWGDLCLKRKGLVDDWGGEAGVGIGSASGEAIMRMTLCRKESEC